MSDTRQSLLLRAQTGDTKAWNDLVTLYRPLIAGWLRYQSVPLEDQDDLVQEILLGVVRSLGSFAHTGRRGAFRTWLRTIARNTTCDYWESRRRRAPGGDEDAAAALQRLEDPDSGASRVWDEEHDRYVVRCLLDLIDAEFEPKSVLAFRRVALERVPGSEAARELGLSVGAVYAARSRVLRRLREEAQGLLDEIS